MQNPDKQFKWDQDAIAMALERNEVTEELADFAMKEAKDRFEKSKEESHG